MMTTCAAAYRATVVEVRDYFNLLKTFQVEKSKTKSDNCFIIADIVCYYS